MTDQSGQERLTSPNQKYCIYCGAQLQPGAMQCDNCGAPTRRAVAQGAMPPPAPNIPPPAPDVPPPPPTPQPAYSAPPPQPLPPPPPARRTNRALVTIIVVVILLCLCCWLLAIGGGMRFHMWPRFRWHWITSLAPAVLFQIRYAWML